jgi:hypothetical protein
LYCVSYHGEDFVWLSPGYEYNFTDMPIHLILGTDTWFSFLEAQRGRDPDMKDFGHLLIKSRTSAQSFAEEAKTCLLY